LGVLAIAVITWQIIPKISWQLNDLPHQLTSFSEFMGLLTSFLPIMIDS
jgi:hypothetical protein